MPLRSADFIRRFCEWLSSPQCIAPACRLVNPRRRDFKWSCVGEVLVLKLDAVGDFVLATPFLRELRRNAPQAHITLVVRPDVHNLAETCPYVNTVLTFDDTVPGGRAWQLRRQLRALAFARRHLRARRIDVAIIPRLDFDPYQASQLATYAGAGAVVGFAENATQLKRQHNRGYDRLLTHVISGPSTARHEVIAGLSLLESTGGSVASTQLELWLTAAERAFAAHSLPLHPPHVAIATGAAESHKKWPADRFAAIVDWLHREHGLATVLVGRPEDPALPVTLDLRGRTTLRQAAAVLERSILFIGNDSGPKHLAAAVHIPIVEINGFRPGCDPLHHGSPARFHAWDTPQSIVQPPPAAGESAIGDIAVERVQAAIAHMLAAQPRPGTHAN